MKNKHRHLELLHYEPARIEYEKIMYKGALSVRITGLSAAEGYDLPEEYLKDYPHFMKVGSEIQLWWENDCNGNLEVEIIRVGSIYRKDKFEEIIRQMKVAGERLTKIVRKINNEARRKKWCGKGEVVI